MHIFGSYPPGAGTLQYSGMDSPPEAQSKPASRPAASHQMSSPHPKSASSKPKASKPKATKPKASKPKTDERPQDMYVAAHSYDGKKQDYDTRVVMEGTEYDNSGLL